MSILIMSMLHTHTYKAKIHTVPSLVFPVEATELDLRTQHLFLLLLFTPDWPNCFDVSISWALPLSAIIIIPCSYKAEIWNVHSFALISQVASYSNSNWSLLFETAEKFDYFHLMVQFLCIPILFWQPTQLIYHPSALKTSVHLYIGCLHRPT